MRYVVATSPMYTVQLHMFVPAHICHLCNEIYKIGVSMLSDVQGIQERPISGLSSFNNSQNFQVEFRDITKFHAGFS